MRKKYSACAILATLLLSFWLTGCVSGSREAAESLTKSTLYQPPVLRLSAKQEVQTKDGRYTPQIDEIWHSDARYRTLEQENIDLAAALLAKKP